MKSKNWIVLFLVILLALGGSFTVFAMGGGGGNGGGMNGGGMNGGMGTNMGTNMDTYSGH